MSEIAYCSGGFWYNGLPIWVGYPGFGFCQEAGFQYLGKLYAKGLKINHENYY